MIGTAIGAAIAFVREYTLKNKELKIKLWEKIIDRRIHAHEVVLDFSKTLRKMIRLDKTNEKGRVEAYPEILTSKETYDDWHTHFLQTFGDVSTWLSTDLTRELNLLQDYMINLEGFLRLIDQTKYHILGSQIRFDFIAFSSTIEKLAFEFFRKDLHKLKLNDLTSWHKYAPHITTERLHQTNFFKEKNAGNFMELLKRL